MDSFKSAVDVLVSWILLPATFYGAGGAMIRAIRKGRSWKQAIFEAGGGIFVANMLGPLVTLHTPPQWHYTLYFLVGWGGLEFVGRMYEAGVAGLEDRIKRRTRGE